MNLYVLIPLRRFDSPLRHPIFYYSNIDAHPCISPASVIPIVYCFLFLLLMLAFMHPLGW
jgi:hypothetical protein